MAVCLVSDEELASIRVGSAVRHRDGPPFVVLQLRPDFILELVVRRVKDAPSSLPRATGVSTLYHEALDVAMEQRPVVVTTGTQRKEILGRERRLLTEDLDLDIAQTRVQADRHLPAYHIVDGRCRYGTSHTALGTTR